MNDSIEPLIIAEEDKGGGGYDREYMIRAIII
jgi:hypothetical protein